MFLSWACAPLLGGVLLCLSCESAALTWKACAGPHATCVPFCLVRLGLQVWRCLAPPLQWSPASSCLNAAWAAAAVWRRS